MNNQLLSALVIASAITPTAGAAAQTAINSSIIDTANADGVVFLMRMGSITTGAVTSVKAQHGDNSALSDAADIEGSSQTIGDGDDGEIFAIDIHRPTKRYVRIVVTRGTQDAVVASAEAMTYGMRSSPVTQPAGTNVELIGSPISGTA